MKKPKSKNEKRKTKKKIAKTKKCKTKNQEMKNQRPKNCTTENQKIKRTKTKKLYNEKSKIKKPKTKKLSNENPDPSGWTIILCDQRDKSHNCPVYCRTCCCQGESHPLFVFFYYLRRKWQGSRWFYEQISNVMLFQIA